MKKVLAILLALVMIFSLAACGKKDETKTYKVGVSIYQFDDNFMTLYRNELESYMKSLETDKVKYDITIVDGKNDMATQSEQIDTFITQNVDVIILNLVQTSSAEALVKKVVDAGIPLILINREPAAENMTNNQTVCYVGADARQSGTYQGEIVVGLENHGDVNGDGTVSYISGASQAFLAVVKEFVRRVPNRIENGVNILGMTPLDFPLGSESSVKCWLKENGMEMICCLGMGCCLDDVRYMKAASINLVVSETGVEAAEYLRKYYDIPYVFGVPVGKGFSSQLADILKAEMKDASIKVGGFIPKDMTADDNADTLVIAEGVYGASLCAALKNDCGISAGLLCPLPAEAAFYGFTGGSCVFAEEDIEAFIKQMSPSRVIADPLYKYVIPAGIKHTALPHLAFSGRSFKRSIPDLINTDIKEYFK